MNTENTATRFSVGTSYLTGNSLSSFLASLVTDNLAHVLHANVPAQTTSSQHQGGNDGNTSVTRSVTETRNQDNRNRYHLSLNRNTEHLTGESLNTFLASLQTEIEQIARNLYYSVPGVSVDLQDLTQEGMIAAWQGTRRYDASKIVNERSFRGYCIKKARGAMLNHITRTNKLPAISLDEYLEVDTDNGPMHREIAYTPVQHHQVTLSERRRILAALRRLTTQEQLVILSHFHIDNSNGRCISPDTVQRRLKLSGSAYYSTRARAVKKLATVLQPN